MLDTGSGTTTKASKWAVMISFLVQTKPGIDANDGDSSPQRQWWEEEKTPICSLVLLLWGVLLSFLFRTLEVFTLICRRGQQSFVSTNRKIFFGSRGFFDSLDPNTSRVHVSM